MAKNKSKSFYWILLFIVILVWGFDPLVYKIFYRDYSASVVAAIATFSSFIFFTCISFKNFKKINIEFFKIYLPIGFLNGIAGLLQRIGLQYTTPANYAFLEHLAVAVVPIVMFIIIKKKPSMVQIISVVLCVVGCFILSGVTIGGFKGNIGDILCALSGIVYGVCIALVGINAKKIDTKLYMVVFSFMYWLASMLSVVLLHNINVDGKPIEVARFVFDLKLLVIVALFGLLSVGITWLMKTSAIKHLDPTFVAVVSPFTAVVSGILSVITKTDTPSVKFIVGGILITIAAILSGVFDVENKKSGEAS